MYTPVHHQTSLIGEGWIYPVILEQAKDNPLVRLRPLLDKVITRVEPKLRALYANTQGRPAYPPSMMLKLLILEYLYNLSDVAVCKICVHDLLFRWFVGLDVVAAVPDDSTLVVFRKRLQEDGFRDVYEELVAEAEARGFLKGKLRVIDATHVFSATPKLGMLGLIRQGLNRVIKGIKQKSKDVAAGLTDKYRHVLKRGKRLTKAAKARGEDQARRENARRAVADFAGDVRNLVDPATRKLLKLLARIAQGNPDKLVSLTDPDARWGHKSEDFAFGGFKVHISCTEKGFVPSLEVLRGNVNEQNRMADLLEPELAQDREIKEVYGDALYDTAENRRQLRKRQIKAYIPAKKQRGQIDEFEEAGERVKCRQGKYSIGKIRQEGGDLYYFSMRDCGRCPNREGCVSAGEVRKKVYISDCRRLREQDYREKYPIRTEVERRFGHVKDNRGMRRARYRGLMKMGIQALLTFMTDNALLLVSGP